MVIAEVEAHLVRHRPRRRLDAARRQDRRIRATGAFNAALGLLAGPNARPGHTASRLTRDA